MYWLKRFQDDHANIVRIMSKLEGNLKDIEYGEAGINVIWELREFVELVHNVIIPHFKAEEETIYPRLSAGASKDLSMLVASLYEEHNQLYKAFDGFEKVLLDAGHQENKTGRGRKIAVEMARSGNIDKMEVPKNFNNLSQVMSLDESIDTETLLQHGLVILQLLEKHLDKEKVAQKLDAVEKNT